MPAKIIEETEAVAVTSTVMVIYGAPGTWKTSLVSTAADPLLFDFDRGLHRTKFRKRAVQVDTFSDVYSDGVRKAVAACRTIGVDTAGRMLDTLAVEIAGSNPKMSNRGGGLSLQGFGVLKDRFKTWVTELRATGKDVVLICHEKEEKQGDDRILRPDIQGGSYSEVHKQADMIGYLSIRNGRRWLDFNPTDTYLGKNAAGFPAIEVPPLNTCPDFLGRLIAEAKSEMSRFTGESAEVAKAQQEWHAFIQSEPTIDALNSELPCLADIKSEAAKKAVKRMIADYANQAGFTMDVPSKKYVIQTQTGGAA